ncbi:MAG: hypothetical protein OQJ98_03130 [Candidatus Pacebacteria bacterium]|nr:hypothetical protein [Candidatus Paceibacterota bacterium]
MNDINIHQLIRDRFAELPEKLQQAITSTEVAEKLREIATKYRLHLDQGQILENETYMVLLGIEEAGKYEENIRHELNIPKDQAEKIATEVAQDIFLSVRNELKARTTEVVVSEEGSMSPTQKLEQTASMPPKEPAKTPIAPTISPKRPQTQQPQPTEQKEEFADVVTRGHKEIKLEPPKGSYAVDPYREPVE